MAAITTSADLERPKRERFRGARRRGGALGILLSPVGLLVVLFVLPMLIMVQMSFVEFPPNTDSGYTLDHYREVLTNDLNLKIAWRTVMIASISMAIMLAIALPLSYFMAFKAGRWELVLLLGLVLADELAPVVKVYAWQVILGRNGILNWLIPGEPIEWLLYSRFAVIVTLSTTYITYTTIPIYAAMKAIEPSMFEAAVDLGAGWWQQARKILLPLAAPGIFIAMILVYIPMLTDFVTSDIVGGTSSVMMGQRVRDLILQGGDWGAGSALNFLMLAASGILALVAYRLAKLNRIDA
ncbi:MAG TPA: ABC transporter permease [Actinomycetota bacterium]|nr:ABC transporter permease [Actinomycetota bacterium]